MKPFWCMIDIAGPVRYLLDSYTAPPVKCPSPEAPGNAETADGEQQAAAKQKTLF